MMRRALLCTLAMLGVACGSKAPGVGDAGCVPSCDGKQCGSDGCGGFCAPGCNPGWTCSPQQTCECASETPAAFCLRHQKQCGELTATDNCGAERTVACDTCPSPQTCDQSSGICACVPEQDDAFCARVARCGSVEAPDNCGATRQIECGCPAGKTCNEATQICDPCTAELDSEFCARLAPTGGKRCGFVSGTDNCGASRQDVDCGACDPGYSCDAATQACAVCTPESDAAFCSDHGAVCGSLTAKDRCALDRTASCGDCTAPLHCSATTNTCEPCVAQSDREFCADHGAECGPLVAPADNCGNPRTVAECGPCGTGMECGATGQCHACVPESDAELCRRNNKWCGNFAATDRCGQARTVADCGSCPNARACGADGRCANGTRPPNDDCSTPDVLVFDASGHAHVSGDTAGATGDTTAGAPCAAGLGADVVYQLHLTQPKDVSISLQAAYPGAGAQAVLYVRTTCDLILSQLDCAAGSVVAPQVLTFEALSAGDYFLWVDADDAAAAGPFTLDVQLSTPVAPPANDLCVAAEPLVFVGDLATAVGTTLGATDDGSGSCAMMNGGDVVYSFTLPAAASLVVTVQADYTTPGYKPAVHLLDSCGAGAGEVGCGATGMASIASVPAGPYVLVVDGLQATRGNFNLTMLKAPPVNNDSCTAPYAAQPLVLDPVTKSVTVVSDTNLGTDGITSSCNSYGTGKDLVFSYEVPAGPAQNVAIVVTPLPGSALEPNPSVRTACEDPVTEIGCAATYLTGTPLPLNLKHQLAGTYYLWVDGWTINSNGPFSLTLAMSDAPQPPANDLCSAGGAQPVRLDPVSAPTVTVPGTTLGAVNDSTGSCWLMGGGDVAYVFNLASAARVTATVTRDASTPTWQPGVYIADGCPGASVVAEKGCGYSLVTDTAVAGAPNLAAGTYYVIVDGLTVDDGNFTLTLNAGAPMLNDSCASPAALQLDLTGHALVQGDTTGLADDAESSCSWGGPDAVYSLTVPSRKNVEFILTPTSYTDQSVLLVRSTCDQQMSELRCQIAPQNAVNRFTVPGLMPGNTYYVWVDGYWGTSKGQGAYTLAVIATDPQPPLNDTCAHAEVLAIDPTVDSTVSASGTTMDAAGDSVGSCQPSGSDPAGGDVVYTFTLGAEKRVQIEVTPHAGSSLKPVLYLVSTTCGTGAELACAASTSVAATRLDLPFVAAGTYYLVVDSAAPMDVGAFDVTLTTSASPTPPANDTCAAPQTLAFDAATGAYAPVTGSTANARDDYAGRCSGPTSRHSGGDVVYAFTLPSALALTATVIPDATSPGFQPALYIQQSACGGAAASSTVACGAAAAAGAYTLNVGYLAGGIYYLVVDGVAGSRGGFDLSVTTHAPIPGDSCANAIPIAIVPGTHFHVAGTNVGAVNDAGNLGCAAQNIATGDDLVYSFSTVGLGALRIDATLQYSAGGVFPAMSLRTVCDTADPTNEVACAGQRSVGAIFVNKVLAEGTYWLWVDTSFATDHGPYDLDIDLRPVAPPPANDLCSGAVSLGTLPASGSVTETGSTYWANDDYAGTSCGAKATDGGDVAYSFVLAQPAMVTASLTRDTATSPNYRPALYLQRASCGNVAAADQVACSEVPDALTDHASLKVFTLAAGTYYLVVDGVDRSSGAFTLEVTTAAPRAYPDNCASTVALAFDANGHAQVHEELADASNDTTVSAACTMSTMYGPDLVYTVDTTSLGAKDLVATVTSTNFYWSGAISLRSACGQNSSEVACHYQWATVISTAKANLAPGVYYLWVNAEFTTGGYPIDLTVDLYDPVPATPPNDTCATYQQLALDPTSGDVRVRGATNGGAGDPTTGSCAAMDGPDVVYRFNMRAAGTVYAAVTRDALSPAYEPALHIRTTCATSGSTSEEACARQSTWPAGLATVTAQLPAGDHYLIVDGTNGTEGRFELYLSAFAAATNDDCTSPLALTFDPATGDNLTHGTTLLATDSGSSSCNLWGSGSDLVYQITVPAGANKDLSAELAPLPFSRFEGVISLWNACAMTSASTELGCNYTYNANTTVNWKWPNLAGGTYYLWVDSFGSGNEGAFELRSHLADHPAPPANDNCTSGPVGVVPQIQFDLAGHATVPSATIPAAAIEDALDDTTGVACASGAHGADVVYSFVLTTAQKLTVTLTPSSTYLPSMYLRKGSCSSTLAADEVACAEGSWAGSTLTLTKNVLPADTYYLWVDSGTSSGGYNFGTYALDLAISAAVLPPTNDTCASPIALALGTAVTGDTSAAANDFMTMTGGGCTGRTGDGPDVVFTYTPSANGDFTVSAAPGGSGWDAVLWVTTGACDPAACVRRADALGGSTNPEVVTVTGATAGTTYYIVLDGFGPDSAGPYSIVVN